MRLASKRILLGALVVVLLLVHTHRANAQAVSDPRLTWLTIRSAHFDIHYHEPLGVQARRIAALLERADALHREVYEYEPTQRTQVVLTDDTDSANGSATAIPFNTIRLYSTAPEDLSPLADYDEWMATLVTHEHQHIAQLDSIRGLPAIVNRIVGKIYAPHHLAPRWLLEGFAVFDETDHTSGGRLRSSMWDMFMRADVLGDRIVRLDQITHTVDRWPYGNVWYLYGSMFAEFLARQYGREILTDIVRNGSDELVMPLALPFLTNGRADRSLWSLYDLFVSDLRARYGIQEEGIRASGLVEGRRITEHGENAQTPRFITNNRLVYWAGDNQRLSELRVLDLSQGARIERRITQAGTMTPAPTTDDRIVYSGLSITRDLYAFNDLFVYDGREDDVTQLTHGLRAQEPDVSPNGERVVFTQNGAGTTNLMIADFANVEGTAHELVRSRRFDQVYTPRFSPDGRTVAASFWRRGGFRDIGLVDVATGHVDFVMHDRAIDSGPAWSPDGRTLYFASDRTGVSNIYALDVETRAVSRVSNVLMGAYMPNVSPDGKHIAYVGYSTFGWDIFVLDLEGIERVTADPYVDARPVANPETGISPLESESYSPWPSILPSNYGVTLVTDGFGYQLGMSTAGSDVVGLHGYSLRLGIGLERGDANIDARYAYNGLPLKLSVRGYRIVQPRGGLELAGRAATWVENLVGGDVNASYSFRRLLYSHTVSANYALSHSTELDPIVIPIDPNEPGPRLPTRGFHGQMRVGYGYSSVRRFPYDVSPSDGASVGGSATWVDPVLGAQFRAVTLSWYAQTYVLMPWLRQHVLAMRYGGGIAIDDRGPRNAFGVGGFPDVSLVEALVQQSYLGGVALRGFPPNTQVGSQYHLAQIEYRFPLWRPQWGAGTLPLFLHRLHLGVFTDIGHAFRGAPNLRAIDVGLGAELFTDLSFLYYTPITLRVGVARGVTEGGTTQFYAHLGTAF